VSLVAIFVLKGLTCLSHALEKCFCFGEVLVFGQLLAEVLKTKVTFCCGNQGRSINSLD